MTTLARVNNLTHTLYEGVRQSSNTLCEAENAFGRVKLEDVFFSLFFTHKPEIMEEGAFNDDNPMPGHYREMGQILQLKLVDEFRNQTILNPVESAIGAVAICEELSKIPEDVPEELKDSLTRQAIENAIDNSSDTIDAMNDMLQQLMQEQDCMDESEQQEHMENAMGHVNKWGDEQKEGRLGHVEAKYRLAELFKKDKKFQNIIESFGRLLNIEKQAQKLRPDTKPAEVVDVEQGADFKNVLPSEWAMDDDIVDQKIVDRKLNQLKLSDREEEGKGGIILLQDKSGSMWHPVADPLRPGTEQMADDWATAIMLSMMRECQKRKSDFLHIPFSGNINNVTRYPKGGGDVETVLKAVATMPDGGTSWTKAIRRAIKEYRANPEQYKNADIIMITDGWCDLDPTVQHELAALKEDHGCRFFAINVMNEDNPVLEGICEEGGYFKGFEVSQDRRDEVMTNIYEQLQTWQ